MASERPTWQFLGRSERDCLWETFEAERECGGDERTALESALDHLCSVMAVCSIKEAPDGDT